MSVTAKEIMEVCRNIFDEVSDAICVCDLQGRLLYLNRAAEKLDGIDFALVRGRSVEDIYGVDPAASPLLKALRGGETVRESRFSYWINGREVVQSCMASPLIVKNEIVGAYSVQHDLTEMQRIVEENLTLQREAEAHRVKKAEDMGSRYDIRSLIGENAVFSECRDMALRAAESDSSVMLVGDTGSGKELFARAIHEHSHRKNGPFLALNCAAIPEDLLEGILFGTAKGVYTGAVEREGLLLQGQGGTIFLDEINSMPPASQAKLLRVLEERKVYKLGAAVGKEIDIRIISSTNELPASAVDRGVMRNDLFYRLSVVYIRIPSLAERKDDIPLLVDHFIEEYNRRFEKNVLGVAANVMGFFMDYPWSGNVRQLKHCIESAMNFTESGQWISFSSLPPYLFDAIKDEDDIPPAPVSSLAAAAPLRKEGATLMETIKAEEKESLIAALKEAKGNMAKAARILGIDRQAVVYRVKKYGLK